MVREQDGDMTGDDPLSSAAQGDEDGGSAELAGAGARSGGAEPEASRDDTDGMDEGFASGPPHPEALDDTPVTDAPPASGLEAG